MPDIFDRLELPVEHKVINSPQMQQLVAESVSAAISRLPLQEIIAKAVNAKVQEYKDRLGKEFIQRQESEESLKVLINDTVNRAKLELNQKMEVLDEQMTGIDEDAQNLLGKFSSKFDEITNKINYDAPQYTFGGYPPPGGGLPLPGVGGLMEWRFIVVDSNLSVQKLENGIWTEKAQFNP